MWILTGFKFPTRILRCSLVSGFVDVSDYLYGSVSCRPTMRPWIALCTVVPNSCRFASGTAMFLSVRHFSCPSWSAELLFVRLALTNVGRSVYNVLVASRCGELIVVFTALLSSCVGLFQRLVSSFRRQSTRGTLLVIYCCSVGNCVGRICCHYHVE